MPEYILFGKPKVESLNEFAIVRRFYEKDKAEAVKKAVQLIDKAAQSLTAEHRFELIEAHFVPLPSEKWIINYGKKEPELPKEMVVKTECMVTEIPDDIRPTKGSVI